MKQISLLLPLRCILLSSLYSLLTLLPCAARLIESERMEEYHRRGHTWPPLPQDYTPNTPGWRSINERRFHQLSLMDKGPGERYQGYVITVHSALTSQNFTEYGWGVTKAPRAVVDKLVQRLQDGLAQQEKTLEHTIMCVETESLAPYFLHNDGMNEEILRELLPLHEAWSGKKLVPNNAYGLRVYRNGTNLNMHLDKSSTHIISSILHVGHGENDEPWPLVIEDFHGNTNEVFLETGDLLFYESSKLMHGRPKKMNGQYYSSLFSHYYPVDWDRQVIENNIHYRIPGDWDVVAKREAGDETEDLLMIETSMKEPQCPDAWCGLKHTKQWYGPAPGYGKVLTGGGKVEILKNIPIEESFDKNPPREDISSSGIVDEL
jgi:hypothetical protein